MGSGHVFEMVNNSGRIYSRTGAIIQSFTLASFFVVQEGLLQGYLEFDPKILYDAISERWFASYDSKVDKPGSPNDVGRLHLAVSDTNDPTGAWHIYQRSYGGGFPDFSGIGVTSDKLTVSSNVFPIGSSGYAGEETIVIEKADVVAGLPAAQVGIVAFPLNTSRFTVRPAHSLSPVNDQYLVMRGDIAQDSSTNLILIRITGTPAAGNVTEASVTTLTMLPQGSPPDAPTAGGGKIDSGDFRILDAMWRDGRLWASASAACIPAGDTQRSCAHLIEVDTVALSVTQDILFGAPGQYYSFPAVRTDASGDLYVSLTQTNSSVYAEGRATGRLSSDPPNTLSGTVLLAAGEVSVIGNVSDPNGPVRWGDYLDVAVDPNFPECVWLVGEYAKSTTNDNKDWGTTVASASFSGGCDGDNDGIVDASDKDDDNDQLNDSAEVGCGSNPTDASSRPERLDGAFAGVDDDGDAAVDEALPPDSAGYDCDGDGYIGAAEFAIYVPATAGDQDPCGYNGWPSNVSDGDTSANKLDIQDIISFIAPVRRLDTSPPNLKYSPRWDLTPGPTAPFPSHINIIDITTLLNGIAGSPAYPSMFGNTRAFGKACPFAP